MIASKFSPLNWFVYPIKKYYSTCIAFTLVAFFISSAAFFIGFSDDENMELVCVFMEDHEPDPLDINDGWVADVWRQYLD